MTHQTPYQFFLKHAGYSYDPKTETQIQGRRRCARSMAKAEREASEQGYTFKWSDDPDGCIGCDCGAEDCDCSTGSEHETLVCIAVDGTGEYKASLGAICKPSREYRRVIEAELALESLDTL
jgi:predicted metal-binding protein